MKHDDWSSAVREMPESERPRERLAAVGAEALSDAELLAILFRTGARRKGALALANDTMRHFGDLRGLAHATLEELQYVKGLGKVKSIEIKAALELGKRLALHRRDGRTVIQTAQDVADLLMVRFKDYEVEHFKAVLLNTKHHLIQYVDVSQGGLDGTLALPRDVFRHAVRAGAAAVIVCHNHPSGDPEPSREDVLLTTRLAEAARLLGIRLLDHVIFGDDRYVSLQERSLL